MKRKGILLSLAVVGVLAVWVSVAVAARSYSTKIKVDGVSGAPSAATVYGHLKTSSKCLGPRLMAEAKKTSSGYLVVDQDYSSAHGAFAFRGNIGPLPATLRIEVSKAKIRNRRGHVVAVCQPDIIQFTVNPPKLGAAG